MPRKQKSMNDQNVEVLSARVNTDLYKRVAELARQKDLTVTQIVLASLRDYVARNQPHAS